MNRTKASWYTTTPPSTPLARYSTTTRSTCEKARNPAAQAPWRARRRNVGWRTSNVGLSRKPVRYTPITGTAQNATTPSSVPRPRTSFSGRVRNSVGGSPWRMKANSRYDRDHDHVVDRRGEHGQREVSGGVEHRRRDQVGGVEQDLRQEEPQQEGAELHLRRLDRRLVQTRHQQTQDPGAGDQAGGDDGGQQGQHGPEHHARRPLGFVVAGVVDGLDHDRHQHRLQHAGREQLEQDVRDGVGALVGVAQVGGAQDGGDDDDPCEPGGPADGGERRHPGGVPVAAGDDSAARRSLSGHPDGTVGNGAVAPTPVP